MHRFLIAVVVLTPFCLFAFSEQDSANPFEVSYSKSGIQWSVFVPSTGFVLTVSGPNGLFWRQEYGPDSRPQFGSIDEQGMPRPEGLYRWELVAQLPLGPNGEVPDEPNPVESGSFVISGGMMAPKPDDVQPAAVEEGAPLRSLFLDRDGRLGMGTTVPQSQLHLRGGGPAFTLEDTSTGGGVFTVRGLKKGDGSLGLFDQAGNARWLVDSQGRMGINTTKLTSTLTVDGYIEATKGFLINGKPVGMGLGFIGGSQPLYVEGASNNYFGINAGGTGGGYNSFFGANAGDVNTGEGNAFFGAGAGDANTTGYWNDFFGWDTGGSTTTGRENAFFGDAAGFYNTTGSYNAFFGRLTGLSNTVASNNTLIGAFSDVSAGITNATAVGYRAKVAASNSLVLGSINGVNGGTSYTNVGIGTTSPARQLHVAGPNAVFRIDRNTDTAAFILVRTDAAGTTPWKSFVVGANATGVNQGEFIINDIGNAVGGMGLRRMTIRNDGSVQFTGTVYAPNFLYSSSRAFKTNIRTFENALETVSRLRGVRFDWKDSGKPAVGLIAEEVDEVVPELVAHEDGQARGVNYANLVAVLVEAVKEQQQTIQEQQKTIQEQQKMIEDQTSRLERVESLLQQR